MQKIKLIIFDLDGTLVDAYTAITSSFNYAMQKLGYSRQPKAVIRRAVGWGDRNLFRPFLAEKDLEKALKLYRRHHQHSLLRQSRLFPGVKALLGFLKRRGYKIAVASNRPTRFSRILMRHHGLNKYFSYVLCADRLKKGKPHPEIFKRILRRLSVRPKEALYIGDMAIDILAGKAAGIRTVVVTTGSSTRNEIKRERPWRIIERVKKLKEIF